jgi:ribose transport system ATP-binding protein
MLEALNITKKFAGVTALNAVNLRLMPGKVTAIIGENGAGKSTLMKILSGVYPEYEGKVVYKGQEVHFANPREAQQCGIAIIHQELNLIPDLSIFENIYLGRELTDQWGFVDRKAMRSNTQRLLERLKLNVSPNSLINELKVGQQQVVEIAKALLTDADVLIMDEPTSAISEHEVDVLFGIIEALRDEGKIIVYISHKLDELFKIADAYIVMRDGCVMESGEMQDVDHDGLINKMVGREIQLLSQAHRAVGKEVLLRVEGMSLQDTRIKQNLIVDHVSFQLHRGEILGLFGLMGAGRTELLETIVGMHHVRRSGTVWMEEQALRLKSPQQAIREGIVLVPEDRKKNGLVLNLDIKTNVSLSQLSEVTELGFINRKKDLDLAQQYVDSLKIKCSSPLQQTKNLSGGNQQKVVLARCLVTKPRVLLLDEPTRGIDPHAKNEIYKLIVSLAEKGMSIVVVSSELPEILGLSDRVMVMCEGKLTATFQAHEANEDNVLKAAIPKTI